MTSDREAALMQKANRAARRLQLLMWRADTWFNPKEGEEMRLKELRIQGGPEKGGRFLVIAKALDEGRLVVGFHDGDDLETALKGALERIGNGDMKWREDKPYEPGS